MTTLAADNGTPDDQDSDKNPSAGLLAFLVWLGLAGLKRRNDAHFAAGPAAPPNPNIPWL
jgi:hypothetical protein